MAVYTRVQRVHVVGPYSAADDSQWKKRVKRNVGTHYRSFFLSVGCRCEGEVIRPTDGFLVRGARRGVPIRENLPQYFLQFFTKISCGKKNFATSAIFSNFSVDSVQCSKKCLTFYLASYIFGYSVQSSCNHSITPGSGEQC
jgi:hypothetical protein